MPVGLCLSVCACRVIKLIAAGESPYVQRKCGSAGMQGYEVCSLSSDDSWLQVTGKRRHSVNTTASRWFVTKQEKIWD